MVAQPGAQVLIKIHNGTALETVGGMRSKSISFNQETVDVSDSDSAGKWRELGAQMGFRTASLSGSGLFKDTASEEVVRSKFFSNENVQMSFTIPSFGTVEGLFQVSSLEYGGEHNAEVTFSATFESAGELTFTSI